MFVSLAPNNRKKKKSVLKYFENKVSVIATYMVSCEQFI